MGGWTCRRTRLEYGMSFLKLLYIRFSCRGSCSAFRTSRSLPVMQWNSMNTLPLNHRLGLLLLRAIQYLNETAAWVPRVHSSWVRPPKRYLAGWRDITYRPYVCFRSGNGQGPTWCQHDSSWATVEQRFNDASVDYRMDLSDHVDGAIANKRLPFYRKAAQLKTLFTGIRGDFTSRLSK